MVLTGLRPLVLAAALVVISSPAFAQRTLYVNATTGNDATPRASNSASTPWRTIGRAAWGSVNRSAPNAGEAAQAGDTVQISAGTYNYTGVIDNRWGVVYNPVNQGTSTSSRITFVASGQVVLTAPSTASPVIGCAGRNHVVWRGPFTLDEANISIHADTGTVVLNGATGCGVDGISVDGDGAPTYIDNHNGVRIEGCQSCFVVNSTIHDVRHVNANHNGAAVMLYNSDNSLVSNNRFYASDAGVFIKGVFGVNSPQSGTVVSFNLMENVGDGVVIQDSRDSRVYQNVIRDGDVGVDILSREAGEYYHPVGDWVVNNTIDNMTYACVSMSGGAFTQNVRVWNNMMSECRWGIIMESIGSPIGVDFEHNTYGPMTRFAESIAGLYTFLTWKTLFLQDSAAPASNAVTDMGYANYSGNDFRLCTGAGAPVSSCTGPSPARNTGLDLMDLDRDGSTNDIINPGAFVTGNEVIGPGASSQQPPPSTSTPTAPTNLRVIPGAN